MLKAQATAQTPAYARSATRSAAELERGQQQRSQLLRLYEEVQQLKRAGFLVNHIRRALGIGYTLAKRFYDAATFPEPTRRRKSGSQVDRFGEYLRRRWAEGCHNSKRLFEELRTQGCRASWTSVRRYVQGWRVLNPQIQSLMPAPLPDCLPKSPSQVLWLLLKNEDKLKAEERVFKEELLTQEPKLKSTIELVQDFRVMLNERKAADFDGWLNRAVASGEKKLINFVAGLRRDERAVRAALEHEWSQGQTEGQVNRLKLIKRQMFGRAKFDLLRARVLHRF